MFHDGHDKCGKSGTKSDVPLTGSVRSALRDLQNRGKGEKASIDQEPHNGSNEDAIDSEQDIVDNRPAGQPSTGGGSPGAQNAHQAEEIVVVGDDVVQLETGQEQENGGGRVCGQL